MARHHINSAIAGAVCDLARCLGFESDSHAAPANSPVGESLPPRASAALIGHMQGARAAERTPGQPAGLAASGRRNGHVWRNRVRYGGNRSLHG